MYNELKWSEINYPFWYDKSDISKYDFLTTENYKEKFNMLLENDEILCENFKILDKKFEDAEKDRITFDYIIEKTENIIYQEINDILNYFQFFDFYKNQSGKCYINLAPTIKQILEYQENDTIIYVQNSDGQIIGFLDNNGNILPLSELGNVDTQTISSQLSTGNAIIISENQAHSVEKDFCTGEVVLEGQEYEFC